MMVDQGPSFRAVRRVLVLPKKRLRAPDVSIASHCIAPSPAQTDPDLCCLCLGIQLFR